MCEVCNGFDSACMRDNLHLGFCQCLYMSDIWLGCSLEFGIILFVIVSICVGLCEWYSVMILMYKHQRWLLLVDLWFGFGYVLDM